MLILSLTHHRVYYRYILAVCTLPKKTTVFPSSVGLYRSIFLHCSLILFFLLLLFLILLFFFGLGVFCPRALGSGRVWIELMKLVGQPLLFLCITVYACMYVSVYLCVYSSTCVCTCLCVYICVDAWSVCLYVYASACVWVSLRMRLRQPVRSRTLNFARSRIILGLSGRGAVYRS